MKNCVERNEKRNNIRKYIFKKSRLGTQWPKVAGPRRQHLAILMAAIFGGGSAITRIDIYVYVNKIITTIITLIIYVGRCASETKNVVQVSERNKFERGTREIREGP